MNLYIHTFELETVEENQEGRFICIAKDILTGEQRRTRSFADVGQANHCLENRRKLKKHMCGVAVLPYTTGMREICAYVREMMSREYVLYDEYRHTDEWAAQVIYTHIVLPLSMVLDKLLNHGFG